MTREELINIMYGSALPVTCPHPMRCEKLSETGSCRSCAEGLLTEYENEIYNKALDDVFKGLLDKTTPTGKYIDSAIVLKVLEQLQKGKE